MKGILVADNTLTNKRRNVSGRTVSSPSSIKVRNLLTVVYALKVTHDKGLLQFHFDKYLLFAAIFQIYGDTNLGYCRMAE